MIQVNKFERKLVKPAQLLAINDNNWYGWSCYIWLESLVIDMKWEIYRGHCKVGGKIWNIHNLERLNLPNKWIRCNKKICNCLADILTTKVNK
jgi:hypothetical protein